MVNRAADEPQAAFTEYRINDDAFVEACRTLRDPKLLEAAAKLTKAREVRNNTIEAHAEAIKDAGATVVRVGDTPIIVNVGPRNGGGFEVPEWSKDVAVRSMSEAPS